MDSLKAFLTAEFDTEERAALIADGCKVTQERALEMALEQKRDWERKKQGNRAWNQGKLWNVK